jgi:predicted ATP-binding protein involved in virulence
MSKTIETSHHVTILDYYTIQHQWKSKTREFVDSNYGSIASKATKCSGYKQFDGSKSGFTNVEKAAKALVAVRLDPENKEHTFRLIHRIITVDEEVVNV